MTVTTTPSMGTHTRADVQVVTIGMRVSEQSVLDIVLARDGSVNRMGGGAPQTADGALFIGVEQPPPFFEAIEHLPDEVVQLHGVFDAPVKDGMQCVLTVEFWFADLSGSGFEIRYGSDSMGPPSEVSRFVHGAVLATQSWYQQSRRLAGMAPALAPEPLPELPELPEPKPWWRFW